MPPTSTHAASGPDESTSVLGGFVRSWARFWFTPIDPTTLGVMRIFCGLVVFYVHLSYSWGLLGYVGPNAWMNKEVANYLQKEMPVYAQAWNWTDAPIQIAKGNYYWSVFYHVQDPAWIVAFHLVFLVAPLLFAAGFMTRFFGAIAWIGAMSYCQRAANTVFGLDTMMMIALAYLNIGSCGAVLSLDRWLEKRRAQRLGNRVPEVQPSYAANFATRLMQVHFCLIYLATGTSKLLGTTWWAGTSLNLVLLNTSFAPLDQTPYYEFMKWLASDRLRWEIVMTASITYTLAVELGFPFLVWHMRSRWFMICCSVGLHTGIGLLMGLVTFSLMMMILLLSFVPPNVMRALLNWLSDAASAWWIRKEPGSAKMGGLVLTR